MSHPTDRLPGSVVVIERDWLSSNHTLLFDEGQATIIDTGYAKHAATTDRLVAAALRHGPGEQTASLSRIVNTHLHSDHCGGNAILTGNHGCRVSVPAASFEAARRWTPQAREFDSMAQRCDRFSAHDAIAPGDVVFGAGLEWVAHAAPGHDPRSLIFFNPDHRVLISADALWQFGFGVIFPEIFDKSGFSEQGEVLRLIQELDPLVVIPGHGPVFDDVGAALGRARKRLASLIEQPRLSHLHAMKVMVKFLLLDREQITISDLHELARQTLLFQELARQLSLDVTDAVDDAVTALVTRAQLTRRDSVLYNA